jgi:hypothetical protein
MEITRESHPALFEAMDIIASESDVIASNGKDFDVPPPWDQVVSEIEEALAKLSPVELETFAIGEENALLAVIGQSYELTTAHVFLSEFFEGGFE